MQSGILQGTPVHAEQQSRRLEGAFELREIDARVLQEVHLERGVVDHHLVPLQNGRKRAQRRQAGVQHQACVTAAVELHQADSRPLRIEPRGAARLVRATQARRIKRRPLRDHAVATDAHRLPHLLAVVGCSLDVEPDQSAHDGVRLPVGVCLDLSDDLQRLRLVLRHDDPDVVEVLGHQIERRLVERGTAEVGPDLVAVGAQCSHDGGIRALGLLDPHLCTAEPKLHAVPHGCPHQLGDGLRAVPHGCPHQLGDGLRAQF